eukprot:2473643-Ditylum_brightwellii.AAC.1
MDRIAADEEAWNFEKESEISIYTYLGLFGSGFSIPILVVFIQIAIMLILLDITEPNRDVFGTEQEENIPMSVVSMAVVVMLLYLLELAKYS